jgi:hypothetical protein
MSYNFPWKNLINIMPYEIISNAYYKPLLNQVINYKMSKKEIETLPSSHILHFISILQLICKKSINGNINNNNNDNNNDKQIEKLNEDIKLMQKELDSKSEIILEYQNIVYLLQKKLLNTKDSLKEKINFYKNKLINSQRKEVENKFDNMKLYMTQLVQSQITQPNSFYYPSNNYNTINYNENSKLKSTIKVINKNNSSINDKSDEDSNFSKQFLKSERRASRINNNLRKLSLKVDNDSYMNDKLINDLSNQFQHFKSNINDDVNNFKRTQENTRYLKKSIYRTSSENNY